MRNKVNFKFKGKQVQYTLTPKGVLVCVEDLNEINPYLQEYVDLFKIYVKHLDDDTFVKAVEEFPNHTGHSIHELAEVCDDCIESGKICYFIDAFKECVRFVKNGNELF